MLRKKLGNEKQSLISENRIMGYHNKVIGYKSEISNKKTCSKAGLYLSLCQFYDFFLDDDCLM